MTKSRQEAAALDRPSMQVDRTPGDVWARESASGDTVAGFDWALTSVDAESVAKDRARLEQRDPLCDVEPERQKTLSSLISTLAEGQTLVFAHRICREQSGPFRYRMTVNGEVRERDGEEAIRLAHALRKEVQTFLAVGYPQFCFDPARPNTFDAIDSKQVWLAKPAWLRTTKPDGIGFSAVEHAPSPLKLSLAPSSSPSFLDGILSNLLSARQEIELRIEFHGHVPSAETVRTVERSIGSLVRASPRDALKAKAPFTQSLPTVETLHDTQDMWEDWIATPYGAAMHLTVASEGELSSTLLMLLGSEVMQGRFFRFVAAANTASVTDSAVHDLSAYLPANASMPPLMPSPSRLAELGFPKGRGDLHLSADKASIVLGDAPTRAGMQAVSLADMDRTQHCYLIGATGTGKSTLLQSMIDQDIRHGHGVAVFDPHGDLFHKVLANIPRQRAEDVVILDFTDLAFVPGMNLLELTSEHRDIERNSIIRDMSSILQHLYGNVPESMGPMFFMYMRNVLALLMADTEGRTTLLDVSRVMWDKLFRNHLLQQCQDSTVAEFWKGIATQAQGDGSLKELAPYITNKFTEFTQNALVKRIVGQNRTSFDFREAMDKRQIVLVNLSKGLLNDMDSRFLGMLLTGKLFRQAAGRASVASEQRLPFHVYIDEFQNLTSDALTSALAESRKYGLALTLAHQDSAQVSPDLMTSLLTNVATKLIFRVGPSDAKALSGLAEPALAASDLMSLPDHHTMARMKTRTGVSPPFIFRTRCVAGEWTDAPHRAHVESMVARSRRLHCLPTSTVESLIQTNRWAPPAPSPAPIVEAQIATTAQGRQQAQVAENLPAESQHSILTTVQTEPASVSQQKKATSIASLMREAQDLMRAASTRVKSD